MESTGDVSSITDNADRATQTEDEELAATLAEREIGEIAEIDAALGGLQEPERVRTRRAHRQGHPSRAPRPHPLGAEFLLTQS